MRQISLSRAKHDLRASTIKALGKHLETRTYWGRHMARPSQIPGAARKLYDVLAAQVRRERKQAVQG